MPPKASEDELCQALLEFVTDGTYPESEDVVASEFPASAVPDELQCISKAREETEVRRVAALKEITAADFYFLRRKRYVCSANGTLHMSTDGFRKRSSSMQILNGPD